MNCKNCDTTLTQESKYCYLCGGKIIRKRLTLKNLFQHLSETFFNYDNKLLQTIISLFVNPHLVIDSYVKGVRKKYINPISFFAINLTISGVYIFIFQKYYRDLLLSAFKVNTDVPEVQTKINEMIFSLVFDYSSILNSAFIPIIALISFIVFINKKYNYTEHIVVYLYTMSLFSIVTSVVTLIIVVINPKFYATTSGILYVLALIYHCLLLKKLFKLNGKQLLLKTLLFIPIFLVAYLIMIIVVFGLGFAVSDLTLQDFAPKN